MKCETLECFSEAVAESKDTGKKLCTVCAIKVASHFGINSVKTLKGARFPWDYTATGKCDKCGKNFNGFLIGTTGECPACRSPLPGVRPGFKYDKVNVTYKEGQHD